MIFSRFIKKELDPIDFSILVTDIHSHLLPGIDDGAIDLDDSIELKPIYEKNLTFYVP